MIKSGAIKTSIFVLSSFFTVTSAIAQPTYEEDMARQRAEWQRNQDAYQQQIEAQNAADEEEYYHEQENSQPQIQYSKNNFALAFNKNYDAVWASWNHPNKSAAENAAVSACKKVTDGDCKVLRAAWNSSIALARANDGFFESGWGVTPYEAQEAALKNCGSRFCTIYKTYDFPGKPINNIWSTPKRTSGIDDDFPKNPAPLIFTILVAPKKNAPFEVSNRIWAGSGYRDFETGKNQLTNICKSKTTYDCEVIMVSGNAPIGLYLKEETGSVRFIHGANYSVLEGEMNDQCQKENSNCHLLDSIGPQNAIIKEFNKGPRKVRGYLALSLSQQPNNQIRKLTISLGNNSLENAQANAINECQIKSNYNCALVDKNLDDGTYVYIGLYYTQKRNVTWFFGSSEESITSYAEQNCKNCEMIAIVDAREKGLKSFNLYN